MPRMVAPQPAGEGFQVVLSKPFSGAPTHQIEVIGELNRPASVRMTNYNGNAKSTEKKGDVPQDDVRELMTLISTLRGFPSDDNKDIYNLDTKLDFATFEIQWSNQEDDPAAQGEVGGEQKDEFKRVVDSVEALARQFAKQDSAI
ncbi:hypothetical protein HBH56_127000 [Parastagonospora nodorum]|uniref:Uncharacterized protein n=2 Tax=Phaeosphaeria nodorum (strain SN15 / ATCC MYA-4574 / FGSC 10173) TaxID=321614 RepID=A0A7U2I9L2_PHANO|nr:hypothetical protein SNOG_06053 [Parastagonospora nodorum SN15]KAH3911667.1 hypothetical protein HBH56_127000 [Parastagonospora nodorum]EAT87117.1 hypothetical protein SNOG_06053 [Parastagonospora nodorum SN15]KAH3931380.1 hypothetical protein HBH54_096500 [Parastagonospora nodorum]KAH3970500.1 hypothetical protein HBH51_113710 [Parastagonospora nodorum]KAH3971505.1 hypothetical protein HBH52_155980 [Parastagonospora nodorum]